MVRKAFNLIARHFAESWRLSFQLFKIMIPVIVVVKVLDEVGAINWLGRMLAPAMKIVGLPGSMAVVWASAMVANIYSSMVVFFQIAPHEPTLTGAQATVLATMILIAHTLPVEVRICQAAGARLRVILALRLGAAILCGAILFHIYQWGGWFQGPAPIIWFQAKTKPTLPMWLVGQVRTLTLVFFIVMAMLALMKILRRLGVTDWMNRALRPVLVLLGIGGEAATLTVMGMILGIAYGGALIIDEAKSGRLSPKDVFYSLTLMSLCHSLIEDTLLVKIMGSSLTGILVGRLVFALVVTFALVRLVAALPQGFQMWLFRAPKHLTRSR